MTEPTGSGKGNDTTTGSGKGNGTTTGAVRELRAWVQRG